MKEKDKKLILLIIICLITLWILFSIIRIHNNREDNILSTSKIDKYLTEIRYDEIDTHIVEQPDTVIYVTNSSDNNIDSFERNFKKVIKRYNLENEIIYTNINDVNIIDPIYQYAPELIFYKSGEVSDIIDCTTLKTSKDIINILKERGVISD